MCCFSVQEIPFFEVILIVNLILLLKLHVMIFVIFCEKCSITYIFCFHTDQRTEKPTLCIYAQEPNRQMMNGIVIYPCRDQHHVKSSETFVRESRFRWTLHKLFLKDNSCYQDVFRWTPGTAYLREDQSSLRGSPRILAHKYIFSYKKQVMWFRV